jgi:ribonuclease D
MAKQIENTFEFIEDKQDLDRFFRRNRDISWMGFDTEFVGEKRYTTLICLIQIATEHGYFLIDPLKLDDISPFLEMVQNPKIEKITHAGENDYRLLNHQYGILPSNTFDAQMAAGFVGYKYPISFSKLIEGELHIHLNKGYAVTNWEARPIKPRQIQYALDDVVYLFSLSEKLKQKLKRKHRLGWAKEEISVMERQSAYDQDPHKEALNSNLIHNLKTREKLFLIRLFAWRSEEARRRNHSRDMVLQSKLISHIVRGMRAGLEALRENRRLPSKIIQRFGQEFQRMYDAPMTSEEEELLKRIPREGGENAQQDLILEMLHLLIRYKCLQEQMSPDLVFPRAVLKKLKGDPAYFDPVMESGWREEFLGPELVNWLRNRDRLEIVLGGDKFELSLRDK